MKKCMNSKICTVLNYNIKDVWNIITHFNNYKWRSNISYVQSINNSNSFIEYYKNGDINTFKILEKINYRYYKLKIINKKFVGIWECCLYPLKENRTQVVFLKTIYIKNPIKRFFAKHLWNIRKLQIQYIADMKNILEESSYNV